MVEFASPDTKIMYDDIPIKIYRNVHTIGKIYVGGLKAGLFSEAYIDIFPLKKADKDPTAKGIRIEIIRVLLLRGFISSTPRIFITIYEFTLKDMRIINRITI